VAERTSGLKCYSERILKKQTSVFRIQLSESANLLFSFVHLYTNFAKPEVSGKENSQSSQCK